MLKNMFEKLFANAGAKIKLMAKINFVLWVIAGAFIGFLFAFVEDDIFIMLPIGIAGGFIIGWLSSIVWFLIGETAKNISMIHNDIANIIKGNSNNNDDNIYDIAKIIKERK